MYLKISSLNRPLSPHLSIYNSQITSLASIWHRISGVLLIVLLVFFNIIIKFILNYYVFFNLFLLKVFIVYFIYLAFLILILYHGFNGLRYILWDLGYILKPKNLIYSFCILCSFISIFIIINII
nr:succinate dehydrogenase subunit 3 [Calliblepharis sp.]